MSEQPRRHGYIEAPGTRLFYETAGTGSPVLLIHAGIADHTMWDDQVEPLAARYRVIRFDMRGFGRSVPSPQPFSPREDLLAVLDALEVRRAQLIGCSIGGRTALDFTLEHPDRVSALVLVGAGVSGSPFEVGDLAARWDEIDAAFDAGDIPLATELETRMWVDGPYRSAAAVDPAVRARAYAMNLQANQRDDAQGTPLELTPPAHERLAEIAVPVLAGEHDVPAVLQRAEFLATRIAGARRHILADTAHLPNMEQPELFNQVVLQFLDSLPEADRRP